MSAASRHLPKNPVVMQPKLAEMVGWGAQAKADAWKRSRMPRPLSAVAL
jgi:hypothetical protein